MHPHRHRSGIAVRPVPILLLLGIFVCLLTGCGDGDASNDERTVLRLWHFWSEPAQRAVLQQQITDFQRKHPFVVVELTELQWSDGKAKLQLAFNSGNPPDVVHIGMEWIPQFAAAGVLGRLSDDNADRFLPGARSGGIFGDSTVALPWVVNTRALMMQTVLHEARAGKTMLDVIRSYHDPGRGRYGFGIASNEPHNVMKRVLPFMIAGGSKAFLSRPYWSTLDDSAVVALERYVSFCDYGINESSRNLDERFVRGDIGVWVSGAWILASAARTGRSASFTVLDGTFPLEDVTTAHHGSILSGDYLAVSNASEHRHEATLLIDYLTSDNTALAFCEAIPDAGVPAGRQALDTMRERLQDANAIAFCDAIEQAPSIEQSIHFLDAERIFEEEVMMAIYRKKTARQAVTDARDRIKAVETR